LAPMRQWLPFEPDMAVTPYQWTETVPGKPDGARLAVERSPGGEIEQKAGAEPLDDVPDADTLLHGVAHPHMRNPSENLAGNLFNIAQEPSGDGFFSCNRFNGGCTHQG